MVVAAGFAVAAAPAATAAILSDFDVSGDGWSALVGADSYSPSGGNPSGHLRVDNDGAADPSIAAPAKFLGDQSSSDGGAITIDARLFRAQISHPAMAFHLRLELENGDGDTATIDLPSATNLARQWITFVAPLDAGAWGVSQSMWTGILADVVAFSITFTSNAEPPPLAVGFDNILMTPTPGAAALLALALPLALPRSRAAR